MLSFKKKPLRIFNRLPGWILIICSILITVNAIIIYNKSSRPYCDIELTDSVTARVYSDGELYLKGYGATPNYSLSESSPLDVISDVATKLTIEEGITSIGDYLFYDFCNLSGDLIIPSSVIYIGECAFSGSSYENAPKFNRIINNFVSYDAYGIDNDVNSSDIIYKHHDDGNSAENTYEFENDVSTSFSETISTDSSNIDVYKIEADSAQITVAENAFYTLPTKVGGFAYNFDIIDILAEPDTDDSVVDDIVPEEPETEPPTEPETEPPTEPETEPPTEPETEPPTEPETEAPTEPETEPPTEPETEAPTESETEPPTEPETEPPTEPETEPPTESETEAPTESETEPSTEPETEAPTEPTSSEEESAPTDDSGGIGGGKNNNDKTSSPSEVSSTEETVESSATDSTSETSDSSENSESSESTEPYSETETESTKEPEETQEIQPKILIYQQTLGENVFFPGQVGIYECSEKNRSFIESVESAGYIPYDNFALVRDAQSIDYSKSSGQNYFSVWATAKERSEILYQWQILHSGVWFDCEGQTSDTFEVDVIKSVTDDSSYRCRISYGGETIYSSAVNVIFEIDKPSLIFVNNKAILSASLPHFENYISSAKWQYSPDGSTWADTDCSDCIYQINSDSKHDVEFYRFAVLLSPKNQENSENFILLKISPSVTVDFGSYKTSDFWSGQPDYSWYNTFDNSFVISTPEQLAGLSLIVNGTADGFEADNFAGKSIKLSADINLNSNSEYYENWQTYAPACNWIPIGSSAKTPFSGTFDGNGHSVSGMYISSDSAFSALFGYASNATIKRVRSENTFISADNDKSENAAGLVAVCDNSVIKNCSVSGIYVDGKIQTAGGIAATIRNSSQILNCSADGSLNANSKYSGGIVGLCEKNGGAVVNCKNSSNVVGSDYCGGIVGYSFGGCELNILTNNGSISSNGMCGGIAAYSDSPVTNAINTGTVSSAQNYSAGIVGTVTADVTNCYGGGTISGASGAGGIVGSALGGNIENCFSDCLFSGAASVTASIAAYSENSTVSYCYGFSANVPINGSDKNTNDCALFDKPSLLLTEFGKQHDSEYFTSGETNLIDALNEYVLSKKNLAKWQINQSNGGTEFTFLPQGSYITSEKSLSQFIDANRPVSIPACGQFSVCCSYKNLLNLAKSITFSTPIPQNTSVTLFSERNGYYSFTASESVNKINLSDFVKIGSDKKYSSVSSGGNVEHICLYFDFSNTDGSLNSGKITLTGNAFRTDSVSYEISERTFSLSNISSTDAGIISGSYSTGVPRANDGFVGMSAALEISISKDGSPYTCLAAGNDVTYKPVNSVIRIPVELSQNNKAFEIRLIPAIGENLPDNSQYDVEVKLVMQPDGVTVAEDFTQFSTPETEPYTLQVSAYNSIILMPDNGSDAKAEFSVIPSKQGGDISVSVKKRNVELGTFEDCGQWEFEGNTLIIPSGSIGTYKITFNYSADGKIISAEQTIIVKRP